MREVIKLSSRDIYVAFDEHKSGRYAQHVLSVKKFSKKTFNATTIAPVPNYIISIIQVYWIAFRIGLCNSVKGTLPIQYPI